jgi:hypothetical protein
LLPAAVEGPPLISMSESVLYTSDTVTKEVTLSSWSFMTTACCPAPPPALPWAGAATSSSSVNTMSALSMDPASEDWADTRAAGPALRPVGRPRGNPEVMGLCSQAEACQKTYWRPSARTKLRPVLTAVGAANTGAALPTVMPLPRRVPGRSMTACRRSFQGYSGITWPRSPEQGFAPVAIDSDEHTSQFACT